MLQQADDEYCQLISLLQAMYDYTLRQADNQYIPDPCGEEMNILSKINISIENRPRHFSAVLHTSLGIVRWLIQFFTVTEEDRLAAGCCLDYEERDR